MDIWITEHINNILRYSNGAYQAKIPMLSSEVFMTHDTNQKSDT